MSDTQTPTLASLTEAVIAFRDERDWKQFHNAKDVAISLSLEASELLELFQWVDQTDEHYLNANRERLSDEMADIFYWLLLMSHDWQIDLGTSLLKKLEKNNDKYPVARVRGSAKKYNEL